MADGQLRTLLRHIRRAIDPRQGRMPDSELLQQFIERRDEAAFEVLLWRHGPLVLNVCQRLLHQEQDAEDAFQATFLTLARKAGSISRREAVGAWLYRVAYRIALAARTRASRSGHRLRPRSELTIVDPTPEFTWHEVRLVLDEEVNRLPATYRAAFVLCYLEGRTNEEAAQELGCPKGTVLSRLSRARERLRRRLLQRGLAHSTGLLTIALSKNAPTGTLPDTLIDRTLKAAVLIGAGKAAAGIVPTQITALMEGALRTMFLTKVRITGTILLSLGLIATGVGMLGRWATATRAEGPPSAEAAEAASRSAITRSGGAVVDMARFDLPPARTAAPRGVIPVGMRAVTILTPPRPRNALPLVVPGSKVDVLFVSARTPDADRATTLLQNVQVLAVGERGDASPGDKSAAGPLQEVVSLLLTPDQAAKLVLAQNVGTLHLALRNPDDDGTIPGAGTRREKPLSEPRGDTPLNLRQENQRLNDQLQEASEELDILRAELDLVKRKAKLRHHGESSNSQTAELRKENACLAEALKRTRQEMERVRAEIGRLQQSRP
jgi:Flp pilus assembly protein CpaB